jgi:hypothetical protein
MYTNNESVKMVEKGPTLPLGRSSSYSEAFLVPTKA